MRARLTVWLLLAAWTCAHADTPLQGQLSVYGRLKVAAERANAGKSVSRLTSGRSVLGFKGDEDLCGGYTALFQIEGAVQVDTGGGTLSGLPGGSTSDLGSYPFRTPPRHTRWRCSPAPYASPGIAEGGTLQVNVAQKGIFP